MTELVVASLLVAVAITISLGLVGDWRGQYQFSGMVNSFQSAINLARSRAIARQDYVRLIIKMKASQDVLSATEDSGKTSPLNTLKALGMALPVYGTENYFTLDLTPVVSASQYTSYPADPGPCPCSSSCSICPCAGPCPYGQDIWFYCDSGADTGYTVQVTPASSLPDVAQVWFDPRGFAVEPVAGSTKPSYAVYSITISRPKSGQTTTFTVSPLGRIKQGGAS